MVSTMFDRPPASAKASAELLPFEWTYSNEYFEKIAEAQINETPATRSRALHALRELIQNDKLTCHMSWEEDFLMKYLRVRKFDAARAFKHLKCFEQLKQKHLEHFRGITYESIWLSMENQVVSLLPYRCPDGCVIMLSEIQNWDPDVLTLDHVKKLTAMYILGPLEDRLTQITGFKFIFDVTNTSLRHIKPLTPQILYLLYHSTQECFPARYKEIHFISSTFAFKAFWVVMKTFLSEKIKNRIRFHDSHETLLDYFPPAILPVKYGGHLEKYTLSDWLKRVTEPNTCNKIMGGGIL